MDPLLVSNGLNGIISGFILSGLLIGTWEWADVTRYVPTPRDLKIIAVGSPMILLLTSYWGPITAPFGAFVILLVAMWSFVPPLTWKFIGSLAIVGATFIRALSNPGSMSFYPVELGVLILVTLALFASSRARTINLQIALPLTVFGLLMVALIWSHYHIGALFAMGTLAMVIGAYTVSHVKRAHEWQTNIYRAEHDALTGSLNRDGHASWLAKLSPHDVSDGAIVACDVDDFKWFNDTWGHGLGDQVLRQFVQRVAGVLDAQSALVRPGGDEFVVWIPHLDRQNAASVVGRIHQAATATSYDLAIGPNYIGVSMGWAVGPLSSSLAQLADHNLLMAKRQGKNRCNPPVGNTTAPPITPAPPSAQLGWLGDASDALWTHWQTAAVLTNMDGHIIAVNAAYEQLCGRSRHELVGKKPAVNSAGETSPDVYQNIWQTLTSGRTWHGRLKNRRPDGTIWWAEEWIVPIQISHQTVGYWAQIHPIVEKTKVAAHYPLPIENAGQSAPQGAEPRPTSDIT